MIAVVLAMVVIITAIAVMLRPSRRRQSPSRYYTLAEISPAQGSQGAFLPGTSVIVDLETRVLTPTQ